MITLLLPQGEAYPGAKIQHSIQMITLLLPQGEPLVTKLILSFSLNNRELGNATQHRTDVSNLYHTATLAFPQQQRTRERNPIPHRRLQPLPHGYLSLPQRRDIYPAHQLLPQNAT
jgi:hypothetical protein